MATQTPIKYNSSTKKHEVFISGDTVDITNIPTIPLTGSVSGANLTLSANGSTNPAIDLTAAIASAESANVAGVGIVVSGTKNRTIALNTVGSTSGQVLTSSGAGVAPVWNTAPTILFNTGTLMTTAELFQAAGPIYASFTNHVHVLGSMQSWTNTDTTRTARFCFEIGTQGGVDAALNASYLIGITAFAKVGSAPNTTSPFVAANPDSIEGSVLRHESGLPFGRRISSRSSTLKVMEVPPLQTIYYIVGHDYYVDAASITIASYMYTGMTARMIFLS